MIRDLVGTLDQHKGEMGLLILLHEPTKGMTDVADHSGVYEVPMTGTRLSAGPDRHRGRAAGGRWTENADRNPPLHPGRS